MAASSVPVPAAPPRSTPPLTIGGFGYLHCEDLSALVISLGINRQLYADLDVEHSLFSIPGVIVHLAAGSTQNPLVMPLCKKKKSS